ncbi:MAG: DUF3105 domain-containing protein [Candidatus Woykebacteria bacterium]
MGKKPDVSELSKKERKEFLKDFRKSEEQRDKVKSNVTKIVIAVVMLAVLGGLGYLFLTADQGSAVMGEEITIQSRDHINPGTPHPSYNSNPPTSGPHWPTPQTCDIYNEPVADESAIHSLEHGAVWITYKDKDDTDLAGKLKAIVEKNKAKVLLSPRPENDSKIALSSWGRLMKLSDFDENQISQFIKSNRNNSPEPLAACQGTNQTRQ